MADIEKLSVLIETAFRDKGAKAAERAITGLSSSLDKAGSQAESSAKRSEGAFSKIGNAIGRVRGDAAKGADFELRASDSGMDGIEGAIRSARSDAAKGADFELRASGGVGSLSQEIQSVRQAASRGATFEVDTGSSEAKLSGLKDAMKDVASVAGGVALGDMAGGGVEGLSQNLQDTARSAGMLQAQLGLTKGEAQQLKSVGLDVYTSNWGDSMGEVTNAIGTVQNGLRGLGSSKSELQGLTESAFVVRDAFGIDIPESVEAVRQMTQNFGIEGQEAFDLITAGAQKGANSSGDLADSLREYSPYFAEIGLSADQAMATFVAGTQNGIRNTDVLADGLKEFTIRAVDGSDATAEGFRAAGLDAENMAAAIAEGGPAAERAFQKTIDGLNAIEDPRKREEAGVALFGTMYEDLGPKMLKSFDQGTQGLKNVEGATGRAGDALSDNFGAKLAGVTRQAEVFVTETLGISGGLGEVAAFGGNAGMAVGGFALAASTSAPLIGKAATATKGLATASLLAYAPLALLAGIGLIAIGIAWTFDYDAFGEAREKAKAEGRWVGGQYADGILAGLEGVPILNRLSAWIGKGVDGAMAFLTQNAPEVTLWDVITGENKASESNLLSKISSGYNSAVEWMSGLQPKTSLWDVITGRKKGADHSVLGPIQRGYNAAVEWMSGLQPETSLWDVITGRGKAKDSVLGKIQGAYDSAIEWLEGLAPETSLWDVLTGKGDAGSNPTLGRLQGAYQSANAWISGLQPETSLWDVLTGRGEAKDNQFLSSLDGVWSRAQTRLGEISTDVQTKLSEAKTNGLARASELGTGLQERFASARTGTSEKFAGIREDISSRLGEAKEQGTARARELGTNLSTSWTNQRADAGAKYSGIRDDIGNRLSEGKERGTARVRELGSNLISSFTNQRSEANTGYSNIRDTIGNRLNEGKERGTSRVRELGSNLMDSFTNQSREANSKYSEIRDTLGEKMNEAKDRVTSRIRELGSNMFDSFENQKERALSAYQGIRDNMTNPIQTAKENLQGIWNSILEGISKVLGAVSMDELAGKVSGAKWAHGGTTEDGGGKAFARGGLAVSRFAAGGMGTSGKNPRMHLWNEQQGNEAYIVENRPTSEQMPYLKTAAGWHGMDVVPRNHADRAVREASGKPLTRDLTTNVDQAGITLMGFLRGGLSPEVVQDTVSWAKQYNGRGYLLGGSHPGQTDCSGWMNVVFKHISGDKSPSGRTPFGATMTMMDSQMSSYGFTKGSANPGFTVGVSHGGQAGGHTAGTLAWGSGEINTETGGGHHSTMTGGPAAGANGAYNNQYIYGLGKPGNITGAGGGIMASLWDTIGSRIWDASVGRVWKGFKEKLPSFALAQGIGGAGDMILGGIKEKIAAEAGASSAGGEWNGGGELKEWVTKGLELSGAFPATPDNVSKTMQLAMGESGGVPDIIQQVQDINSGGNEARGLMQVIPTTWEGHRAMYGSDVGGFMENWMNPIKNVAVSARYQKARYGYLRSTPGYDTGGVIPGQNGESVLIQAHAGERVLPREVVSGFDRLASSVAHYSRVHSSVLDSKNTSSGSVDSGGREAVERQTSRLEAEMKRQTALMRENARTMVKSAVAAVMNAPKSPAWQDQLDRLLSEAFGDADVYVGGR